MDIASSGLTLLIGDSRYIAMVRMNIILIWLAQFGKTNSSLEFCPPVALFAESVAVRYAAQFAVRQPVFGTHVDDIFGGFKDTNSEARAVHLRK